jgi:hypothetical protein
MDFYALGISLYDLFAGCGSPVTGSRCSARTARPYPDSALGLTAYEPDFNAALDLSLLDVTVKDATARGQLKDLITKLLDKNPVTRLSEAGAVLAHPFFASAKVLMSELLTLGINGAVKDNLAIGVSGSAGSSG